MRPTSLDVVRLPPFRPWVSGSKIAISCHKEREFLIRSWTTKNTRPKTLVKWILHYIGRMNYNDLEWWGYTYLGQPLYMNDNEVERYTSGLTIQHWVEPKDAFMKKLVDEGKIGLDYGQPYDLAIPDKGYPQKMHVSSNETG